jgi:hypothetical protein
MTRVFTRALMLTAVGGLVLAPAAAFADTGGAAATAPPSMTVTQLSPPKDPQANQKFTLSARVSPETADKPGPSAHADSANEGASNHDTKSTDPTGKGKGKGKSGKGKTGKGRGTRPKRRVAETGAVTFTVDGKALPPIQLSRGRASEQLELPSGKHTVTASYSGDENYTASQSAPVTFAVS